MTTYTLISYRPEREIWYHQERESSTESEYYIEVFFTSNDIATELARMLFAEECLTTPDEYHSFQHTILIDGLNEFDGHSDIAVERWEEIKTLRGHILEIAHEKLRQLRADKKEAAALKKAETEKRELRELTRLQAKYANRV